MKRVTREEVLQLAARASLNDQPDLAIHLTRLAGRLVSGVAGCGDNWCDLGNQGSLERGEKLLKSTLIETGVGS